MLHRTIPFAGSQLQQKARERLIEQSQQHEGILAPSRKSLPVQYGQEEESINPFGKDKNNLTALLNIGLKLKSYSNVSNLLNATGSIWNRKYKSRRNNSLQDYHVQQGATQRLLEKVNDKEKTQKHQNIQREFYRVTNINIRQLNTPSSTSLIKQVRKHFQNSHLLVRSIKHRRDAQKEIKSLSPKQNKTTYKLKNFINIPQKTINSKLTPQPMLNTTLSGTNIYHSFRLHKKEAASIKKNSMKIHTCPLENIQISKTIEKFNSTQKTIEIQYLPTSEERTQTNFESIVLHTIKDRYVSPVRNMQVLLQRNKYKVKALRNHAQFNRVSQIENQIQLAHLASPVISPIFDENISQ